MTNNHKTLTMPELLAPAGSLEKLQVAVHYGADAVYLGGGPYSLRAHAVFGQDGLSQAVNYAHEHQVKAYVTINIMAHNDDLSGLPDYFNFLKEIKADGLIIADPGIFSLATETVPEMPIHLSTQANTTNRASALFWQQQGAERINLAREMSLSEIAEIRKAVSLKLEIFVHGALCISYSGRCSLSLYMTGRDANHGNCAHPCRYNYRLEEEKRPGQHFPVEEDQHGTYIFNSKDLCLLNRLPELISAGADSLKIEGRMKSIYYVGAIVRLYRAALDYISSQVNEQQTALEQIVIPKNLLAELNKIGSRGYTENFFEGPPEAGDMLYGGVKSTQTHAPIGIIREAGNEALIEIRNQIQPGDVVEYLGNNFTQKEATIETIRTQDGTSLEKANPGSLVRLSTNPELGILEVHGLLRKKIV